MVEKFFPSGVPPRCHGFGVAPGRLAVDRNGRKSTVGRRSPAGLVTKVTKIRIQS